MGEVKAGQLVDIQFIFNDGEDLSGTIYCYPMEYVEEQFQSFYHVLSNQGMRITEYSDTRIEGTISPQKDGVFMTSIPYDEGWTLYANGEKVETCVVLKGFLGAKLKKGDYTIKLVYHCPGLLKGFITTLFGILFFCMICKVERLQRQQRERKKQERKMLREDNANGEE